MRSCCYSVPRFDSTIHLHSPTVRTGCRVCTLRLRHTSFATGLTRVRSGAPRTRVCVAAPRVRVAFSPLFGSPVYAYIWLLPGLRCRVCRSRTRTSANTNLTWFGCTVHTRLPQFGSTMGLAHFTFAAIRSVFAVAHVHLSCGCCHPRRLPFGFWVARLLRLHIAFALLPPLLRLPSP